MDTGPYSRQKWLQIEYRQRPQISRCPEIQDADQSGLGESQPKIAFWQPQQDSRFHRFVHKKTLHFIQPTWERLEAGSLKR
jgi:hypothetical protein